MTLSLGSETFAGLPASALAAMLAEVEAIAQMSLYNGLPVDTPEQLRGWLRDHLGVRIPDVQVCANHSTPWRAFCDAFFGEHLVVVWEGSRGLAGKTFLMSVLGDAFAILQGADTTILGGSGEQATRVQEYIADWLKREQGGSLVADNRREARLRNHGRLRALMASSRSVRGPHPQKMLCDEVDEMELPLLNAALGQPMTKNNIREQTVLSSTHQYADGTMTDVLARAATNARWSHHVWCYKESMAGDDGWLSQQQIDSKRATVTAQMWETEYDLQEPNPESRAIQPSAVEAMFDERLGTYLGSDGEVIEVEAPVPGGKYVHSADWAKDVDWTILITWRYDVFPYKLVAFERLGRRPWPAMVARFDARFEKYKGSTGYHDATGLGNVIDGYLMHPAQPVIMVGRARKDQLSNYIAAIERGMFKAPRIQWMYTEHKLASVDSVYGSGHLPDTIAAGSLGNLGVPQQYVGGADDWIKHYNDLASGLVAGAGVTFSAAQVAAMLAQLTGPGADPAKIAALLSMTHTTTQPDGQVISNELQGLRRQGNRGKVPARR